MKGTVITCPNCGTQIELTEVLAAQVRDEIEAQVRRQAEEQLRAAVKAAEARAREGLNLELADARAQLAEKDRRIRAAQEAELALRSKTRELEARQKELDLEVQRRLDAGRRAIEKQVRDQAAEEQGLKLKEKEKQIEDLRKALEEAHRKSEQGSQERQGEVLELDLEARLQRQFPHDRIEPVPKGARGADLVQTVIDGQGRDCGRIVWEAKNTKHWQPAWLAKLKDDQRACGAALSVLVSIALPEGLHGFGRINGVWVCGPGAWSALAIALREQLVRVAFAHAAAEGKQEKMELLYQYLAGDQFRHRVQGIVEAFTALQDQVHKERRAMERLWREREKQIERVVTHTVGMYGEMRGLIGATLPAIPALELDDEAALPGPEDES